MIERYLKIRINADGAIETRFETKHERELFYNERESSIWNYKNKGQHAAVQGANVSHGLFENFAPLSNPNRTRGSGAATFRSSSSNLGTQLPSVRTSLMDPKTHIFCNRSRSEFEKQATIIRLQLKRVGSGRGSEK
jgi:hypothetical protein